MSSKQNIIKPQAGFQERFVRSNVDVVIGGGVLNPQPIDSLVATPNGFVQIGKLKSGDIICNTKGGTQKVNFVIDKGVQPCVEFTLSDGRKVRSAFSHNWKIRERHGRTIQMSSQEIIEYYDKESRLSKNRKQGHRNLLKIPLTQPVLHNDEYSQLRTIHPYVLGFIIGDGCMTQKASKPCIYTLDKEVVDKFNELGYVTVKKNYSNECEYSICDPFIKKNLKDLGLWGHTAPYKFIPKAYKYAPNEVKLEFLKGLFDADGCCTFSINSKSPRVSFVTVSKQLADDVKEMIYSLGGICNIYEKQPYDRVWRDKVSHCLKSYTLYPHIFDDKELFFLDRKKNRCKDNSERAHKLFASIKSYEILEPCQMVCINVDDEEHLYLTDNYIVTCNCGKTFASILSIAEPILDSRFRAVFLRNNRGDLKSGGGILDEFKTVYGSRCNVVESGDPHVDFPSGARVDVTHVSDQSRDKVRQRFKGRQYDYIYFDEMTGFSWECFTEICTRNRGTASWTGKIRGTTNPDKNHWLRKFLDWYIGADGFILEDREGVVRYFYMSGETVHDVIWGDSPEDVYKQCKIDIDRKLSKINGKTGRATYKDIIKSFTFYLGRMSENKASIGTNGGYVGSVAMSGGRNAEQLLEGNWNVSPNEELDAPITGTEANQCFLNDPQRNNDKWVTCDLADTGTDNFLCLAWDGFHVYDYLILKQTTPRQNAERLEMFAQEHDVSNSHIIYDAIRGTYINDYIPEAVPFISNHAPVGMYGRMAYNLKAECYMRLVEAIKRQYISFDDSITYRIYDHANLTQAITIQDEFREECAVVRFKDMPSGKKALMSKKEMNAKLGKNRSMDLLDPCAMRFYPVLEYAYGDELMATMMTIEKNDDDDDDVSIYDETLYA